MLRESAVSTTKRIRVVDIRSEDGNEVHIELSDGRIVALTVDEIVGAVEAVERKQLGLDIN